MHTISKMNLSILELRQFIADGGPSLRSVDSPSLADLPRMVLINTDVEIKEEPKYIARCVLVTDAALDLYSLWFLETQFKLMDYRHACALTVEEQRAVVLASIGPFLSRVRLEELAVLRKVPPAVYVCLLSRIEAKFKQFVLLVANAENPLEEAERIGACFPYQWVDHVRFVDKAHFVLLDLTTDDFAFAQKMVGGGGIYLKQAWPNEMLSSAAHHLIGPHDRDFEDKKKFSFRRDIGKLYFVDEREQ